MAHGAIPKIYPNLNPAAAIPVDREQIFRLRSFADIYRLNRGKEHGQYVPNARFVFVTMTSGETLLHQRYRHPALSEGKPVLYAGEASFNSGGATAAAITAPTLIMPRNRACRWISFIPMRTY